MKKAKKAAVKNVEKKAYQPLTWEEVFAGEQLPSLPSALPKMIDDTISQTPDLLKGTVAQVIPVAYSIYPRGLKFVYIDGRTREPRMNCLLVAKEGGGKECITLPIKHILAEVKENSRQDRQRLKEFNDKYNRARQDEEKPKRPDDLDIRPKRAVVYVPYIQIELLCPTDSIATMTLRPTADTRTHLVATGLFL